MTPQNDERRPGQGGESSSKDRRVRGQDRTAAVSARAHARRRAEAHALRRQLPRELGGLRPVAPDVRLEQRRTGAVLAFDHLNQLGLLSDVVLRVLREPWGGCTP